METVLTQSSVVVPQAETSRAQVWTGRVLTGLISAFLFMDALGKLLMLAPVVEASQKAGLAVSSLFPIGVVLFVSTLLHLVRRTQLVGAVLLTAYLGGAVEAHVQLGTGIGSMVMPIVMGVLIWVAYALRNPLFRNFLVASSR